MGTATRDGFGHGERLQLQWSPDECRLEPWCEKLEWAPVFSHDLATRLDGVKGQGSAMDHIFSTYHGSVRCRGADNVRQSSKDSGSPMHLEDTKIHATSMDHVFTES